MKALSCTFQYFQDISQAFRQIATSLVVLLADWTCNASTHRYTTTPHRSRILTRFAEPFPTGRHGLTLPLSVCRTGQITQVLQGKEAQGLNDVSRFNVSIFQNSYSQNGRGMPIVWSL